MAYLEYQDLLEGLAKIVCHSQIEQKELFNSFRFVLAHTAKKEFPDCSISELSQKTGLPRATISEYLDEKEPIKTINKDSILLNELWRIKDKDNKLPLKGENSFYSLAKQIINSSYAPDTSLKALIQSESVELCGEKDDMLLIKEEKLTTNKITKNFTEYTGKIINRFVDTTLYNYNPLNVDKLYDMTIRTTKTPPKNLRKTHEKAKKFMNEVVHPGLKQLVDENEIDVDPGTFPEYTITMFEHKEKN